LSGNLYWCDASFGWCIPSLIDSNDILC
jgi:hypothetical protein